jgi:hypothetical protein
LAAAEFFVDGGDTGFGSLDGFLPLLVVVVDVSGCCLAKLYLLEAAVEVTGVKGL